MYKDRAIDREGGESYKDVEIQTVQEIHTNKLQA